MPLAQSHWLRITIALLLAPTTALLTNRPTNRPHPLRSATSDAIQNAFAEARDLAALRPTREALTRLTEQIVDAPSPLRRFRRYQLLAELLRDDPATYRDVQAASDSWTSPNPSFTDSCLGARRGPAAAATRIFRGRSRGAPKKHPGVREPRR